MDTQVRAMVGHPVHPEEPLMTAGIDSRAAMELRSSLADSLNISLPPTLLYDYQSVNAIVGYITEHQLAAQDEQQQQQQQPWGGFADSSSVEEEDGVDEGGVGSRPGAGTASGTRRGGLAVGHQALETNKTSDLLKMLRPPSAQRPLFLAAPGVANAQSAYFAFAQYLSWSDQPIYVLDKVGLGP